MIAKTLPYYYHHLIITIIFTGEGPLTFPWQEGYQND